VTSFPSAAPHSLKLIGCNEARRYEKIVLNREQSQAAQGRLTKGALPMKDLNNIVYFVRIGRTRQPHRSERTLGVAKSMLSQHLSKLEEELGVQLIKRTTRTLQVTDIGARYYEQCLVILQEMDRASSMIDNVRTLPSGKTSNIEPA